MSLLKKIINLNDRIYIKDNLLIANDKEFPCDFNFIRAMKSSMGLGQISLLYSTKFENVEIMTGTTDELAVSNLLETLSQQLKGNYLMGDLVSIINIDNVISAENVKRTGLLQPHYEIRFTKGISCRIYSKLIFQSIVSKLNEKNNQASL